MRSLFRRLTITHTLVALLAVLLVGLLASGLIVRAYRKAANEQSFQQARAVANRLRKPLAQLYLASNGWEGAGPEIGRRLEESGAIEGRVVLADGGSRVIFDSAGELVGRQMLPRIRLLAVTVSARGQAVGSVAVLPRPEQAASAERTFITSIAWIVGLGSLAATGVALLVALLVARQLVRPLRSMTAAARRLAAGQRHDPLPLPAEAELAELAQAFNSMAAELGRQEDLRRQMVADIAHELRTPLSVLRLQVESIEDGIVPASPAAVGAIGGELDLLARLVDDLRLLSLVDAGQLSLSLQAVDPRRAILQAARSAEARARQGQIELAVAAGEPLPAVRADPQRLAQVLGNLIENAVRYTPAGGRVTLAATAGRGAVVLSVTDTGPGIAPDEQAQIFDRFYRTDRARARETGGSGLGLAIVQRLVEAQGGSIGLESRPGHGTVFSITLPAT